MQHPKFLLAIAMVAGCGPASRAGVDANPGQDGSAADAGVCEDVIDVVFVLDTSSSMGFVLSQLEAQLAQLESFCSPPIL